MWTETRRDKDSAQWESDSGRFIIHGDRMWYDEPEWSYTVWDDVECWWVGDSYPTLDAAKAAAGGAA